MGDLVCNVANELVYLSVESDQTKCIHFAEHRSQRHTFSSSTEKGDVIFRFDDGCDPIDYISARSPALSKENQSFAIVCDDTLRYVLPYATTLLKIWQWVKERWMVF